MKFYANLSGREVFLPLFFFKKKPLWKSYNLFVQLDSQLHRKSFNSSIFLGLWVNLSSCVARQRLVEFFVLNLHLISCAKDFLGKVTVPGDVSLLGSGELCQAGERDRTSGWALTGDLGVQHCREQISRP